MQYRSLSLRKGRHLMHRWLNPLSPLNDQYETFFLTVSGNNQGKESCDLRQWKPKSIASVYHMRHSRGGGEAGRAVAPPQTKIWGNRAPLHFWCWKYHWCSITILKNYLRSTMRQDCLNKCLLMHCDESIMDTLDTVKIAKMFACAIKNAKGILRKLSWGMQVNRL